MTDAAVPAHDAPPAYRPMSGGAVTALVLAILLAFVAFAGFWWTEGLAILVAAFSWPAIAAGRRRGTGLAISAAVVALAVGFYAFSGHREMARNFESSFDGLMTALEKDDRAALRRWVAEGEDADATVARWKSDYDRVRGDVGPYGGRVDLHATWVGAVAAIVRPPSVEVADAVDPAAALPDLLGALWFEAAFQRERLWVALEPPKGEDAPKAATEAITDAVKASPERPTPPIVRALRFFRAKTP